MSADVIPLGAQLRNRRQELGLSQAEAARELEVARTAYRLWELGSSRPAPERWRLIAEWLGISVTAMLLAGEMIDSVEAGEAEQAAASAGLTGRAWDERSGAGQGDFFSQERNMISDQAHLGHITARQTATLRKTLNRMQDAMAQDSATPQWHDGQFRKRLPRNELAPGLARAAVLATAVGAPSSSLRSAVQLSSELVTNSVTHSSSEWIDIEIDLRADRLRVEVADAGTRPVRPRTPDLQGGWGLTLLSELATRWGTERQPHGTRIWFEIDLAPGPGSI